MAQMVQFGDPCTYGYSVGGQYGPPTYPQYQQYQHYQAQISRRKGVGASAEEQLDTVTRSRNALIIALIVFVLAFVACFIALFVLAFPETTTTPDCSVEATTFDFTMTSTIENLPFDATQLIKGNYQYSTMQIVHCDKVTNAAKPGGAVTKCEASSMSGVTVGGTANAGTAAVLVVTVSKDGKATDVRFTSTLDAIEAAQAPTNDNWVVDRTKSTLIVVVSGASSPTVKMSMMVLCMLVIKILL